MKIKAPLRVLGQRRHRRGELQEGRRDAARQVGAAPQHVGRWGAAQRQAHRPRRRDSSR